MNYSGARKVRTVRTTRLGTFNASFDVTTPFDPCSDTLVVTATGARGDSAKIKIFPRACPPAP
jgi:hypothetical protein